MIPADIKTDVKQEIKKLVAVSYSFSQKYLLITCGWHSMQPDIFHEEWGKWWGGERVKGFLLNNQNLLSMTQVICRGTLSGWLLSLEFRVYLEKFISFRRCKTFM